MRRIDSALAFGVLGVLALACSTPPSLGCEPHVPGARCGSSDPPPPTPNPNPPEPSWLPATAEAHPASDDRCMAAGVSKPLVVADGRPYVECGVQAPAGRNAQALFLLDTGGSLTRMDRHFAAKMGLAGACKVDAKIEIAGRLLPSTFWIDKDGSGRGGDAECPGTDRDFPMVAVDGSMQKQDGTIGVDWLTQWAIELNFETRRATFWSKQAWAECSSRFGDHTALRIIDGPTTVRPSQHTPAPNCSYRFRGNTGCSILYATAVVHATGSPEVRELPIQIDTGRPRSLRELLSVNEPLLDELESRGLLKTSSCPGHTSKERCDLGVYTLRPGITLSVAATTVDLTAVEYRDASHGPPYSQSEPIGLVGMSLVTYHSIVLDPFSARALLK